MQRAEAVNLLRRQLDLINAHDLAGAAAIVAPRAIVEDVGLDSREEGRDAWIASMDRLITAFPDLHGEIRCITADGNRSVVENVYEGTHDGPLVTPTGTIAGSGRRVVIRFASVFEFDQNGQATTIRRYSNPLGVLAQIGALETPALAS